MGEKGRNMGDHGSRSDEFDHFRKLYYEFGADYGWDEPNYERLEEWNRREWVAFVRYMDEQGSWPDEIAKEKASDDFYDFIGKAFLFVILGVIVIGVAMAVFLFIVAAISSLTILASLDPLSVPNLV